MGPAKITRIVLGRRGLSALLPRFEEPIAPEFYRFTGKLRLIAISVLLVTNFSSSGSLGVLGIDPRIYWRVQAVNSVVCGADLVLALVLWRAPLALAAMRRLTFASVLLEVASTLLLGWAFGSVASPIVSLGIMVVLIYRIAFDFRIGACAFFFMLIGQWGIVFAETQRWIPPQPLVLARPGGPFSSPAQEVGAMAGISVMMVITFLIANWAVFRLRHKEQAIRILRETLVAADPGRVGRHTGRTLKDTYVVGSRLGMGGMGEVYRGHHRRTLRPVAIKILHPHLLEDEHLLRRFRREAEITGRLGSEHIVEIVDLDRDEELPFMVLELLEGEDLGARVARVGRLPLPLVADIMRQVIRGLEVAHQAGVVHRDLKPENLFLCQDKVKILDFGISKIRGNATALTQEVALLGTPDFMSPEQAQGLVEEVDARADVFALGSITYFALTGRRPFEAASVPSVLRRICDEEPAILAGEASTAAPVVAIAMSKRPEQRYQSVTELGRDLAAAAAGNLDEAVVARAGRVFRGRPSTGQVEGPSVSATAKTVAATGS